MPLFRLMVQRPRGKLRQRCITSSSLLLMQELHTLAPYLGEYRRIEVVVLTGKEAEKYRKDRTTAPVLTFGKNWS